MSFWIPMVSALLAAIGVFAVGLAMRGSVTIRLPRMPRLPNFKRKAKAPPAKESNPFPGRGFLWK